MSDDFVTRLEHQLSEAERLLERGSRASRVRARTRVWRPARAQLLGFAVSAAAAVAVVVGAVALTRGSHERPTPLSRPHVVARLSTGAVFDMTTGFGQVWINSSDHDQVLRVDPTSRRIVARIPAGRDPSGIATAAGAVWVIAHAGDPSGAAYTLSRIDPASNRVTRIGLPGPASALLGPSGLPHLRANGSVLWVVGEAGGVRIDPRRGAVTGLARWGLGDGAIANGYGLTGNDLWVHAADGRLLRLDARTGTRRATLSTPANSRLAAVSGQAVILLGNDGTVTRVDPTTGRSLWRARLSSAPAGDSIGRNLAIAGTTLWAVRENTFQDTERLTAIDLASGRILGSTPLQDLGADWLTVVGDQLWYARAPQTIALEP